MHLAAKELVRIKCQHLTVIILFAPSLLRLCGERSGVITFSGLQTRDAVA